ncbi:MAG: LacI family DNA-binding transcriptional regulator [Leptotrichiaceae bacterium]|nr:LacI family DNA-binding transcriptional regulator [Leptotrichiaceae bacterium]
MNIKEVACKAGVSVATVSRVLNKSEKVSPETEKKVKDIIKKMNYFPNINAKILRENRSRVILICVPDITNIIYSQIIKGILDYLKQKGYSGMIHISSGSSAKEKNASDDIKEYIFFLETKKIDGIIFITSSINRQSYIELNEKYNVMTCSEYFDDEFLETVGINQSEAMYRLTEYLCEIKKVKNPVYYTWKIPTGTSKKRLEGYTGYLKEKKVKNIKKFYKEIEFGKTDIFLKRFREELENNKKTDAVILNSDFYAVFAEKIIKKMDRKILVASFDGTQLLDMASGKIIHIRQPFEEMGRKSAEVLLKKMERRKFEKKIYLKYDLIDEKNLQ